MGINKNSTYGIKQEYTLKDPPNDKKRVDKLLDITKAIRSGDNLLELYQILRPDRNDTHKYACGIFIVRNFEASELATFVKTLQPVIPFEQGMAIIKKRFEKSGDQDATEDCQIE